jgi:hypothetical protein
MSRAVIGEAQYHEEMEKKRMEQFELPPENEMRIYDRNVEEEKQMGQKTAGRFSGMKIRHDLVAPWALNELARVYTYGTQKYDDDNWWKGLRWKRDTFACILRHVWKWFRGEKYDDESGLHHLAHAAWNCFALMSYERHGIGIDDRVPYELDLMEPNERRRRIIMWKKLASEGRDKDYNGLKTLEDEK